MKPVFHILEPVCELTLGNAGREASAGSRRGRLRGWPTATDCSKPASCRPGGSRCAICADAHDAGPPDGAGGQPPPQGAEDANIKLDSVAAICWSGCTMLKPSSPKTRSWPSWRAHADRLGGLRRTTAEQALTGVWCRIAESARSWRSPTHAASSGTCSAWQSYLIFLTSVHSDRLII